MHRENGVFSIQGRWSGISHLHCKADKNLKRIIEVFLHNYPTYHINKGSQALSEISIQSTIIEILKFPCRQNMCMACLSSRTTSI